MIHFKYNEIKLNIYAHNTKDLFRKIKVLTFNHKINLDHILICHTTFHDP